MKVELTDDVGRLPCHLGRQFCDVGSQVEHRIRCRCGRARRRAKRPVASSVSVASACGRHAESTRQCWPQASALPVREILHDVATVVADATVEQPLCAKTLHGAVHERAHVVEVGVIPIAETEDSEAQTCQSMCGRRGVCQPPVELHGVVRGLALPASGHEEHDGAVCGECCRGEVLQVHHLRKQAAAGRLFAKLVRKTFSSASL
mmetsp:Transcript_120963/g.342217  ORF Transcript_120963/g.342217 Transcript_120963/m.342217 type:complete len:205 (+) Transcript_120963:2051-2665(+)